jgi:hypothetical protein
MASKRAKSAIAQLKLRIGARLRAGLERAAKANDRSMNAEISYRLERSLADEAALGGAEMRGQAVRMFTAFNTAGAAAAYSKGLEADEAWIDDHDCYRTAMFGVVEALLLRNPASRDAHAMMLELERLKGHILTRVLNERAAEQKGGRS